MSDGRVAASTTFLANGFLFQILFQYMRIPADLRALGPDDGSPIASFPAGKHQLKANRLPSHTREESNDKCGALFVANLIYVCGSRLSQCLRTLSKAACTLLRLWVLEGAGAVSGGEVGSAACGSSGRLLP